MTRRRHNTAFTLLELMLASAMTAVLAGSLYGTLHVAFKAKDSATRAVENVRKCDQTMELIQADLQSAMISIPANAATTVLATDFVGTSGGSMVGGLGDSLAFYSAVVEGDLGPAVGNVKRIEYTCQEGDKGQLSLVRSVTANLLSQVDIEPKQETLCRGLKSFTMRYFDGQAWQDNWDSTTLNNMLPVAVEVMIEFQAANGSDTYRGSRVIALPCGQASDSATSGIAGAMQ